MIQSSTIGSGKTIYDSFAQPQSGFHQMAIDRVWQVLNQHNIKIKNGESFGLALNTQGELKITGQVANKEAIASALSQDDGLMAMLEHTKTIKIENPKSQPPASLAAGILDTVELSEQSQQWYAAMLEGGTGAGQITTEKSAPVAAENAEEGKSPRAAIALWTDPSKISSLLGLKGFIEDQNGLIDLLRVVVNQKTKTLEGNLKTLLDDNGIVLGPDEKLGLELDKEGVIKVTGLEDKDKMAQIAKVLNDDEHFKDDLASLRANRQVYELELARDAGGEQTAPSQATRQILLKDYLSTQLGIDFNEIVLENGQPQSRDKLENEKLQVLLQNDPSFAQELTEVLKADTEPLLATFSFQNGALVDEISQSDLSKKIQALGSEKLVDHPKAKSLLGNNQGDAGALHKYNESTGYNPSKRIIGFDFGLTAGESFDIDGNFADGKDLDQKAQNMVESWLSDSFVNMTQALSDSLLKQHQAEKGDVDDFEHTVVFHVNSYTGITADIFSEKADEAAKAEIDKQIPLLAGAMKSFLTDYKVDTSEPIAIEITDKGRLKIADSMEGTSIAAPIEQALSLLNMTLVPGQEKFLPESLKPALEPLRVIRSSLDQIHNKHNRGASFFVGS